MVVSLNNTIQSHHFKDYLYTNGFQVHFSQPDAAYLTKALENRLFSRTQQGSLELSLLPHTACTISLWCQHLHSINCFPTRLFIGPIKSYGFPCHLLSLLGSASSKQLVLVLAAGPDLVLHSHHHPDCCCVLPASRVSNCDTVSRKICLVTPLLLQGQKALNNLTPPYPQAPFLLYSTSMYFLLFSKI